jgi:hypothetical protein
MTCCCGWLLARGLNFDVTLRLVNHVVVEIQRTSSDDSIISELCTILKLYVSKIRVTEYIERTPI